MVVAYSTNLRWPSKASKHNCASSYNGPYRHQDSDLLKYFIEQFYTFTGIAFCHLPGALLNRSLGFLSLLLNSECLRMFLSKSVQFSIVSLVKMRTYLLRPRVKNMLETLPLYHIYRSSEKTLKALPDPPPLPWIRANMR